MLAEPPQLRGQVRGVEDAAGARVRVDRIELATQRRRGAARTCVRPGEHACRGPTTGVYADQAVPERRGGHGRDLARAAPGPREDRVDREACGAHALIRIHGDLAVGGGADRSIRVRDAAGDGPPARVEEKDAETGRPDIEREHEGGARLAERDRERLAQHGASMRAARPSLSA